MDYENYIPPQLERHIQRMWQRQTNPPWQASNQWTQKVQQQHQKTPNSNIITRVSPPTRVVTHKRPIKQKDPRTWNDLQNVLRDKKHQEAQQSILRHGTQLPVSTHVRTHRRRMRTRRPGVYQQEQRQWPNVFQDLYTRQIRNRHRRRKKAETRIEKAKTRIQKAIKRHLEAIRPRIVGSRPMAGAA